MVINKNKIITIGMECEAKQNDADGAIGRLWSKFLENVDKVENIITPKVMYGICEHESFDKTDTFIYMAGIEVNESSSIPEGMVRRIIRQQKFVQAEVPEEVKTMEAYFNTFEYIKQNGYEIDKYDEIEVYEEVFRDPANHAFTLLVPIK